MREGKEREVRVETERDGARSGRDRERGIERNGEVRKMRGERSEERERQKWEGEYCAQSNFKGLNKLNDNQVSRYGQN